MVKYVEKAVTFSEFPDEIALILSISNCPNSCPGCSEAYLKEDAGEEVTEEKVIQLISENRGISLIGFMGGDCDHKTIRNLADFIHSQNLKVGMYSGRNFIDLELADCLDYYKIGEFRMFTGAEETWKNQTAGPLCLPTSNQIMFKREGNKLINITDKFRKNKINNWASVIISGDNNENA